ncbi:MAG TPA: alpha-hydroxy-acid oxidizing protein [Nocardioides sp.]
MWRDRGLVEDLLRRAAARGCRALMLTVDTAVTGHPAKGHPQRLHAPVGSIPHTHVLAQSAPPVTWARWLSWRSLGTLKAYAGSALAPTPIDSLVTRLAAPRLLMTA